MVERNILKVTRSLVDDCEHSVKVQVLPRPHIKSALTIHREGSVVERNILKVTRSVRWVPPLGTEESQDLPAAAALLEHGKTAYRSAAMPKDSQGVMLGVWTVGG